MNKGTLKSHVIMHTFVAAKVIVYNPVTHKIILVQRERLGHSYYEPCGGRMEINFTQKTSETLEECAQREAMEELGVSIDHLQYIGNYTFFWTKKENTCSVCILFLAQTMWTGEIKSIADEECCPSYPQWVSIDDILSHKIDIDPRPIGLKTFIQQIVRNIKNCTIE